MTGKTIFFCSKKNVLKIIPWGDDLYQSSVVMWAVRGLTSPGIFLILDREEGIILPRNSYRCFVTIFRFEIWSWYSSLYRAESKLPPLYICSRTNWCLLISNFCPLFKVIKWMRYLFNDVDASLKADSRYLITVFVTFKVCNTLRNKYFVGLILQKFCLYLS